MKKVSVYIHAYPEHMTASVAAQYVNLEQMRPVMIATGELNFNSNLLHFRTKEFNEDEES